MEPLHLKTAEVAWKDRRIRVLDDRIVRVMSDSMLPGDIEGVEVAVKQNAVDTSRKFRPLREL
jgi:hypothetical protein